MGMHACPQAPHTDDVFWNLNQFIFVSLQPDELKINPGSSGNTPRSCMHLAGSACSYTSSYTAMQHAVAWDDGSMACPPRENEFTALGTWEQWTVAATVLHAAGALATVAPTCLIDRRPVCSAHSIEWAIYTRSMQVSDSVFVSYVM